MGVHIALLKFTFHFFFMYDLLISNFELIKSENNSKKL